MLLYQVLASNIPGKSKSYKSNKFEISAPTWYDKFKLSDESNSVSDNQDYFEYIIKKHETLTGNSPRIYINKIENN